jgi:DNA replication and repair protein RecF
LRIEKFIIQNFRNIASASLETNRQFIVISGNNGEGKTNVLEAVFMMASLRSFREYNTQNIIKRGETTAHLEGKLRSQYDIRKMHWSYGNRGRTLDMDGVPTQKILDWFAPIRAILFHPGNVNIVRGGPSERRRFLDRARFTSSPSYLTIVQQYNKVLNQKKALLSQNNCDADMVRVWNQNLIDYGVKIIIQRQLILKELQGPFTEMHDHITGKKEKVNLRLTGLGGHSSENVRKIFSEQLENSLEREIHQRKALVGPHLDDMSIVIDDFIAKKYASQGQARSIVIALKLAELSAAKQRGESPLLLLDDLSSELDRERTQQLVRILSESESQIWITTTEPKHLGPISSNNVSRFIAKSGNIDAF